MHPDAHHHLFHGRVAGALAQAVDGALDLRGAVLHARQRQGRCHAQVVVAMNGDGDVLDAAHVFHEVLDALPELAGKAITRGVGDVHNGCTGIDDRLDDLRQERIVGAAGKIGAAGIDVFEDEPCTQSPLHEFPNAILTPHLGAYTYEAQRRAGVQIADYIAAGLEGSVVPTALNMAPVPPEVMDAVGPYVPACQMMGSMLAQLGGEVPKRLSLTASGKAAPADATILMAGTLQGLLSYKNLATVVTPVNAEAVARRHGIRVDTGAHASAGAYSSSVTVVADGREIGCTLSGEDQHVRLISLLGYKVDIAPGPQALIFQYEDRPGRVGTIGSILGDAGINITTMQIVNDPEAGQAIVYMNIEGELDDSVLAKLRENLEDLKNLWYVKL